MKIIVVGHNGMLGSYLENVLLGLLGCKNSNDLAFPSRMELDITNRKSVSEYLLKMKLLNFNVVINCAASTDVSGIQNNQEMAETSYATNALGPKYLAEACQKMGYRLIHISTDYVYSQHSIGTRLYHDPFPINIYGTHKLIGELFIQNEMVNGNYTILRVGNLYGTECEKSFIHKFLKNVCDCVKIGKNPSVVPFQISVPTPTSFVANQINKLLINPICGTLTTSPTGQANRYQFASEILNFINKNSYDFDKRLLNVNLQKNIFNKSNSEYLPYTSHMGDINQTTHIYGDYSWQDELKSFLGREKPHFVEYTNNLLNK
jgi:dTDP-4-dehydrorhamnose reductase